MGAAGAAIATLFSRIVGTFILMHFIKKRSNILYIDSFIKYKPDFTIIKSILRIGVPNGIENSMFQLGKIIVLSLVSTFGTYSIAANAVSNTLAMVQILPGLAMGLAMTAVISRCVGAGDYEQVKYYLKKLMSNN